MHEGVGFLQLAKERMPIVVKGVDIRYFILYLLDFEPLYQRSP